MSTKNTPPSRERFLKICWHYINNNLLTEIYFNDIYSIVKRESDSQFFLFLYSEQYELKPHISQNQYTFMGYCISKEQCEKLANNTLNVKALRKDFKKTEEILISFYHLEKILRNTNTESAKQTRQFIENQKKIFTDLDIVTILNVKTSNLGSAFLIGFATILLITLIIVLTTADSVIDAIFPIIILGSSIFFIFSIAINSIKKNQRHKKEIKESLYHIVKTDCVNITERIEKGSDFDSTIYTATFANGDSKEFTDSIPCSVGDMLYLIYTNNSREILTQFKASDYTPDINLRIVDRCGPEIVQQNLWL